MLALPKSQATRAAMHDSAVAYADGDDTGRSSARTGLQPGTVHQMKIRARGPPDSQFDRMARAPSRDPYAHDSSPRRHETPREHEHEHEQRHLSRVQPPSAMPGPAVTAAQPRWNAKEDAWKAKAKAHRASQGGNRAPRAMSPAGRAGAGAPTREGARAVPTDNDNSVYRNPASVSSSSGWSLAVSGGPSQAGSYVSSVSPHDRTPYSTLPRDATLVALGSSVERESSRTGRQPGAAGDSDNQAQLGYLQPSCDLHQDPRPARTTPASNGMARPCTTHPPHSSRVLSRSLFADTATNPADVDEALAAACRRSAFWSVLSSTALPRDQGPGEERGCRVPPP